MTQKKCWAKPVSPSFCLLLFLFGCRHFHLSSAPCPSPEELSDIKQTLLQTFAQAPRKQISPVLVSILERSYPYFPPRYVVSLPHRAVVSKDDLRTYCRFIPEEAFILTACDQDGSEGLLCIFSTHSVYFISGKAYACLLNQPALYSRFSGRPNAAVFSYDQLPHLPFQDTADALILTTPEGWKIRFSHRSGIPACLKAVLAYSESPSLLIPDASKPPLEFIKGHTVILPHLTPETIPAFQESIRKLTQTNANYVCLAVMADMETFNTPKILWGPSIGFSDEMLCRAIETARQNGLKIILKPMVNCRDTIWRAWIEFTQEDGRQDLAAWQLWWEQYRTFILHYADIAQKTRCEMLCIGCEMNSTETFEQQWRELIAETRKHYGGLLTYNVNHGRGDSVRFWDALDVIGMSGYYHLGYFMQKAGIEGVEQPDFQPTLEQMKTAWLPVREELRQLCQKWQKPLFFIEIGVCSAKGVSRTPWQHSSPELIFDGQEQADFYQAAFEIFWEQPWFMGFTWWAWPTFLPPCEEASRQVGFEIYCKPAENVTRQWYSKNRPFAFQVN
jgi:hypothetical protein